MSVQSKRLPSIEAFRFLFMLVIILWHFSRFNPFTYGYIVVDFFFILSGFFLYKSFIKNNQPFYLYTMSKLKRFAPGYLIMFFVIFGTKALLVYEGNTSSIFRSAIPELFMVQGIGFNTVINTPTWYISVLLIAGTVIYLLLSCHGLVRFVLPFLVILLYSYLFHMNSSIETFERIGFLYLPLARGFAGIGLGVIMSRLCSKYEDIFEQNYTLMNILTIPAIIVISLGLFGSKCLDKYVISAFCVLVLSFNVTKSIVNVLFSNSLWNKLGGLTYEMLLTHAFVINVVAKLIREWELSSFASFVVVSIYVAIVLGASFLLKKITAGVELIFTKDRLNIKS